MKMSTRRHDSIVTATLGFAAGGAGDGVVYVSLAGAAANDGDGLVRVAFRCRPLPALRGRDIAYAALEAAAHRLSDRRQAIRFAIDDEALVADLTEHRPVPTALTVPYVRAQCALNRLGTATVVAEADRTVRDLTARARAEVALDVAA